MIEIMENSTEKVLVAKATNKLTQKDYTDVLIPKFNELIGKNSHVNCVLYLDHSFTGWEPMAMWEDAKYGTTHMKNFSKIAIVGGAKWMDFFEKVMNQITNIKIKNYSNENLLEAISWASE